MNRSNNIYEERESNTPIWDSTCFVVPQTVPLSDYHVYDSRLGGIMTWLEFEEENLYRESLWKQYKETAKPITDHELLKVFPQGKPFIKIGLKSLHQELLSLKDYEKQIIDICYRKMDNVLERESTESFFRELEINIPRKKIEAQIDRYYKLLKWSDFNPTIGGLDIPKAKSYPITQLIEFRHNTAKCIWHSPDKNPSMYYYKNKNKVKCFSCGKSGDSIDVMMQMRGCSLSEAVKMLQ